MAGEWVVFVPVRASVRPSFRLSARETFEHDILKMNEPSLMEISTRSAG